MANSDVLDEQSKNQAGVPLASVITRMIWLGMLPLFFFAACITIYEIMMVYQKQVDQAATLAKSFVLSTDNALNARISALGILAGSPLVDDESRWHELHKEAQGFYRIFGTHVVITDGGRPIQLLLNTRVPYGTELPVVKRPKGRMAGPIAMRTGKPAVSDLFEGPVAHEPLVGIAVPVLREGKAKYAILTILDRIFFQKELDKVTLPSGWSMVLKDAEQNTIAGSTHSPIEDPVVSSVAESKHSGWTVIVEIPRGPYWRSLLSGGVWLGGILLGVTLAGFLVGKWAGRRLGKALASLTQQPAPDTPSPDIREIAAARRLLDQEMHERSAAENTLRQTTAQLDKRSRELDAILSSVQDYVYIFDPEGHFVFANKKLLDLWSLPAEQVVGKTMRDLDYPESVEAVLLEGVQRVCETGEVVVNTTHYVSPAGVQGYFENVLAPMHGADGHIEFVAGSSRDITAKMVAEAERRRIAQQRQLALDAARMGWWHYDPVTRIASWDDRYKEIFGVTGYTRPNDEILARLHPDDLPGVWSKVEAALDADDPEPYFAEYRIKLPDGSMKWIEAYGIASFDMIGGRKQATSFVGTVADITGRKSREQILKASLDEKEVLLKEIHHRVKNNMQVISSLVDLQSDAVKDPAMRGIFQDVNHRVRSMAMVHEKLYQSADLARVEFADYTKSLLGYLWQAMGTAASGIQLEMNLEPVYLPVNAAVPCGLILNELFSNALKHAFKGRRSGKVSVALHGDDQRKVHLSINDNGIGLPSGMDWERSRSLGLRIVKILARQLHAEVEARNDKGTEFSIIFEKKGPQHEPDINSHS